MRRGASKRVATRTYASWLNQASRFELGGAGAACRSVIDWIERTTVAGRSVMTAPVNRARCSLPQQLSGPATETNRCVIFQVVTGGSSPFGGVGEDGVAELEPPPHALRMHVSANAKVGAFPTTRPRNRRGHGITKRFHSG